MGNKKHSVLCILGVLLLLAGLFLIRAAEAQGVMKTLPYLLIGLGCGLFGHSLGEICKGLALRGDPALAKQMEIEERDERNVALRNQARAKGFTLSTYAYAALLLAFALMGESFRVVIPLVVVYLFTQLYAVYVHIQLSKNG